MPDPSLSLSYDHCRNIARSVARNFYYGFLLLPAQKRDNLCALYAFMRDADDIADSPGELPQKRAALAALRSSLAQALAGKSAPATGDLLVWPALRHTVETCSIPPQYLNDLISGTEMDLTISRYDTFAQLRDYCYHVAGAVGLSCIYVFGFSDPRAPVLAEKMGVAFQLTNILRDVPKDYQMGRIYLPAEDLALFGCRPEDLASHPASPGPHWRELIRFEIARAWEFYEEASSLLTLVSRGSQPALWALARIYSGILGKIEAREFDVFTPPPARLSSAEKVWLLARARLGLRGLHHGTRNDSDPGRRSGRSILGRRAL
jgi:phytoene synthase